ncbi:aromatic amino acid lyase [Cupriavidus basilensis]
MTTPPILTLQPGEMTFADLRRVWLAPTPIALSGDCAAAIEASAATVQAIVAKGAPAYGINTGFGLLAKTQIATHELERLQRNLILSHAVGTGERPERQRGATGAADEGSQSGARLFGRAPCRDRYAAGTAERRHRAVHSVQGFGGRVGRSGTAGAHDRLPCWVRATYV